MDASCGSGCRSHYVGSQPLQERQEAVAELVEHSSRRARLRQALDTLVDFERTLSRLALGTVTPRELIALRRSLSRLPAIALELRACSSHVLTTLAAQWDPLDDLDDLDCAGHRG